MRQQRFPVPFGPLREGLFIFQRVTASFTGLPPVRKNLSAPELKRLAMIAIVCESCFPVNNAVRFRVTRRQ